MHSVLCIDDNRHSRQSVTFSLAGFYEIHSCSKPQQALALAVKVKPSIILVNPLFKDEGQKPGDVVRALCALECRPCVIVLCEVGPPWLVDYMRDMGAAGFISKPWEPHWLSAKIAKVYTRWYCETHREVACSPKGTAPSGTELRTILGSSVWMQELRQTIARVARSDKTVLVCGETGTGKDLAAHCIHQASPRRGAPFVVRNAGAIPDSLMAAELFGCERGAYTGATARAGCIAAAEGGTLFLDEIGEASPLMQTALLRVIDTGDYQALGATRTSRSSFRLICATNRPLEEMVKAGSFRQDLLHRLKVLSLHMPPLRDHPEDIPALVASWCSRENVPVECIHPDVYPWLAEQAWEGNVRELFNLLTRVWVMHASEGARLGLQELVKGAGGDKYRVPGALAHDTMAPAVAPCRHA